MSTLVELRETELRDSAFVALCPQGAGVSEGYLSVVEYKYKCIIDPLRTLYQSMFHCDPPTGENGLESEDRSSDQESVADSLPAGADAASLQHENNSEDENDLRNVISNMTMRYIIEGRTIRDEIEKQLAKNKKDINIMYRWGQASLMDLHDLLDETLADELYYSVRGKMARILCSMSEVEETADKIEKTLVSQLEGSTTETRSERSEQSCQSGPSVRGPESDSGHAQGSGRSSGRPRHDDSGLLQNQRSKSLDGDRPSTRRCDRPPPPVPLLWDSSEEAPCVNSSSAPSKKASRHSPRKPSAECALSPRDKSHRGHSRQLSSPVDSSSRGMAADFPQPGSILTARREKSTEDLFSPEKINRNRTSDISPRDRNSLEKDPYRPPLKKQSSVDDGKIPVADYPPLPKSQPQKQSTVLDSTEYPELPGKQPLTDRSDSQSSFIADGISTSARESGSSSTLRDLENLDSTSGTPEPPTSPRPSGLFNHPKIVKDMLQNLSLPNKYPHNAWL